MNPVIILTGPTASGKSETALALATALDTEIIGADSMQLYKYFDIGTGKPSPEQRRRVQHHLIDVLEPHEDFSAFQFRASAGKHLRDISARGRIPVVTGGTGLYLRALTQGLECGVETDPHLRQRIKDEMKERGVSAMHQDLVRVDPEYAAKISANDSQRVERALTVYYQTGKPLSRFHEEEAKTPSEFPVYSFVLQWDRKRLYSAIESRVDAMLQRGWVDEVRGLLERGFDKTLKPFQSLGYGQIVEYLERNTPREHMVAEIKQKTRNYAKRQMTWFRKIPDAIPIPVECGDRAQNLMEKILASLPATCRLITLVCLLVGLNAAPARAEKPTFAEGMKLFEAKNWKKAEEHFKNLRKASQEGDDAVRALYMLAKIHVERHEPNQAVKLLEDALKSYDTLDDYIRYDLAVLLYELKKDKAAVQHLDVLLKASAMNRSIAEAELLRAKALRRMGQFPKAAKGLESAIRRIRKTKSFKREFSEFVPKMLAERGRLLEEAKQFKEAYSVWRELFVRYPADPALDEVMPRIRRLAKQVSPEPLTEKEFFRRVRGLYRKVRYRDMIDEILTLKKKRVAMPGKYYFYLASAYRGLRERTKANEVLAEFIKSYPKHRRVIEAKYRMAYNHWNLNQNKRAIEGFQTVQKEGQGTKWGVNAHYLLGRLYEDSKQSDLAEKSFAKSIELSKNNEYQETAAWRLAWMQYREGRYQPAMERFRKNVEQFPDGELVEENMFWWAKSLMKLDQKKPAQDIYKRLWKEFPFTYYGLNAREKIGATGLPVPKKSPVGKPEKPKVIKTKSVAPKKTAPPKKPVPEPAPEVALSKAGEKHHRRAMELLLLHRFDDAEFEIRQIARDVRKNLTGVLWLADLYAQARAWSESMRLLYLYKGYKGKRNQRELSLEFWRSLYPRAYEQTIQHHAQKQGVSPYLVRSIIQQESLFDARALSPAGARGLMQIMPKTGKRLVRAHIGKSAFEEDSLFDPEFNLQLGIVYLGELAKQWKQNKTHMLICYNAGPDALRKWLVRFRDVKDADAFVESVPYPETRNYIKRVLRNFGIYQVLYSEPT